jgi:hypothetical protein
MTSIESPIILIGMQRSGTSWLGRALSNATDLAYWSEPRQVWSYGNYFRPDDLLGQEHANKKIKSYIRKRFSNYTKKQGAQRFCEKTPTNCLRIPFVHEVFPQAQFIFLIRDGRAVFRSTKEIQSERVNWKRVRARIAESSVWELPAYFQTLPWLWSKIRRRPAQDWGVHPPGWKEWSKNLTPNQIIARQWTDSLEIAWRDMKMIPEEQKILLRYEELIGNAAQQAQRLVDFLGIKDKQSVMKYIEETAQPARATAWNDEISPECLNEIRTILEPTLVKLGYSWQSSVSD